MYDSYHAYSRVVSLRDSTYRFPKIKYERSSFLSGLFPLVQQLCICTALVCILANMHNNCNDHHDTTTTTLVGVYGIV